MLVSTFSNILTICQQTNYEITRKDELKSYLCGSKHSKVQLIAFNITLNFNQFSFNSMHFQFHFI